MEDFYSRECPHLYRGIIADNVDPMNLGRCRVRVPSIHGKMNYTITALPWARPIVLSPVKSGRGSVNIPDVGDIVWVLFEGADREFPVYFGGTYATGELDIDTLEVDFYIEEDTKITYHRDRREYQISVGGNSITLSPGGVSILGDTTLVGDLSVSGTLTVGNLLIQGSCNKEGGHS